MGGRANILRGVVEDEVFEMDEFALDPQRGAGIGEVGAFGPALHRPASGRCARPNASGRCQTSKAGRIKVVVLIFATS
jgi:hypothetical protein